MAEAKKEEKAEVKKEAPKVTPPAPKAEPKKSTGSWEAEGYASERSYNKFN